MLFYKLIFLCYMLDFSIPLIDNDILLEVCNKRGCYPSMKSTLGQWRQVKKKKRKPSADPVQ